MLFPPLLVPPRSGRVDTWYCVCAFVASGCSGFCASTVARVAPQQTAVRTTTRVWLALLVISCVVMVCLLCCVFHEDTLWTGRQSPPEPLRGFRTSHFTFD